MSRKRAIYLTIISGIVFVYVSLFNLLQKTDVVEAQNCFQPTIVACNTGSACLPTCPGGFLSPDVVNSGFTAGVYGTPIYATLCLNISGSGPGCALVGDSCAAPGDCCTNNCTGASVAGGPLCCGAAQAGICSGGTNALGCCGSNGDCPGGTCLP